VDAAAPPNAPAVFSSGGASFSTALPTGHYSVYMASTWGGTEQGYSNAIDVTKN
jgi:hypothetical protein